MNQSDDNNVNVMVIVTKLNHVTKLIDSNFCFSRRQMKNKSQVKANEKKEEKRKKKEKKSRRRRRRKRRKRRRKRRRRRKKKEKIILQF